MYERVPKKYGTVLTFGLSALWHGFYPGYYITFACGALIVTSARMVQLTAAIRFDFIIFVIANFRPENYSGIASKILHLNDDIMIL